MDKQQEQDIIARVRRGDRTAFATLIDVYGKPIYNLALRMTGQPADAEDLAQETFLRAFRQLHRFDSNRSFFTWLYTISLNLIRSHLKKIGHHQQVDSVHATDNPDYTQETLDENALLKDRLEGLDHHLQALPADLRELLVLRFYQDLPFDAIAEITGHSESAVKMRVYRGLEKLKTLLNDSEL